MSPLRTASYASIQLSRSQLKVIAKIENELPDNQVALSIEETNLEGTVAVKTHDRTILVNHGGNQMDL